MEAKLTVKVGCDLGKNGSFAVDSLREKLRGCSQISILLTKKIKGSKNREKIDNDHK